MASDARPDPNLARACRTGATRPRQNPPGSVPAANRTAAGSADGSVTIR